ncbi:MAG: hypothetical protein WCR52_12505 [Bacteroidota bacterium]
MATLLENVQALDNMVVNGQILEAVEKFFADAVETSEGNNEPSHGKAAKIAGLQAFFADIAAVNSIKLHAQGADEAKQTTLSEYTFDLQKKDGSRILWNEVLRRKWSNGLVINERYYTAA